MTTILCVGVACLDLVHLCDSYPVEDTKTGSRGVWWHRGGNASNSCTVLSLLGAKCEFLGTLGTKSANIMMDDFKAHGISLEHCIIRRDHNSLISSVILNASTGSRTALYYVGDLPELTFEDFCKVDLSQYSWVHFEGRNIGEVSKMMKHIATWRSSHKPSSPQISIELEKPHMGAEIFTASVLADVVFVGKDFALPNGWGDTRETLEAMSKYTKPGATVIVPWGERGAAARGPDGTVVESPAFPPPHVVDTLAAGDTFIAATIFSLQSGHTLQDSITLGCRVAGAKVGEYGLSHIKQAFQDLCIVNS